MKYIELTQGMRTIVDDDLYEWLNQWKWYYRKRSGTRPGGDVVRTLHGYDKDGYVKVQTLYMAALICPVPPGFVVDHIDCDPLNNQRPNLRKATYWVNVINSKKRVTNKSGYKGVSWHSASRTWRVQMNIKGKKKLLGSFKPQDLDKAAKLAEESYRKYHGQFARVA